MKRMTLLLVLALATVAPGAMTNSASSILNNSMYITSNSTLNPVYSWCNEAENILEGTTGYTGSTLYVVPQSATPSETDEGRIYYDSDTDKLYCYANGSWADLTGTGTFTGGNITGDCTIANGIVLRGDTTTAHTWGLQVYDNDTGPGYTNGILFTNGNVPAIAVGAATSSFAVTSTGLNVTTAGNVTGVANLTAAGTISVNDSASTNTTSIGGGTTTGAVSIGTGASAQTVNVGTGAGAKTATFGSTNTTSTTNIYAGSNGVNINASNNQPTNINTGTSTGAVTIGGTGVMTIAVGTGGTGAKTISIGDGASTGTTTLLGGSGGLSINASNNSATNIGTGSTTQTVTIGGTSNNTQLSSANLYIGASDTDVPTIWYGETAGAEMTATGDGWTFDGLTVIMNEGDGLQFGDGGDISLSATTNVFTIGQVVSGTGEVAVGVNNKGVDTTFYAETDGDYLKWDQDGATNLGALIFEDSVLQFPGANVTYSEAISTDALAITATDHANAQITIGSSGTTNSIDLVWQTHTAGAEVTFDGGTDTVTIDGVTTIINEGDALQFGDSGDLSLSSTGNLLTIGQVVSGTGSVAYGVDGKGVDVNWPGENEDDNMLWDQDGNSNTGALIFEDAAIIMDQANVDYTFAAASDILVLNGTDHSSARLDIGVSGGTTNAVDVNWCAHTDNANVYFNGGNDMVTFEAVDITMNDNDSINFGDSAGESTLLSDGSGTDWTLTNGALTLGDGGTTNYSSFAASTGLLTFVGTARPTKTKYLPAQVFTAITAGPVLTTEIGTNKAIGWAMDDTAEEGIATTFTVPYDWAAASDVTVQVYWATSDAAGVGVAAVWDVNTIPLASDEDISGATITVDTATDNLISGTAWDLNVSQAITIAASTEWTAGDLVSFMLFRDGDNAADDVTGDAVVLGIMLSYTSDEP